MHGLKHVCINSVLWLIYGLLYWILKSGPPSSWMTLGFYFLMGSVIFDLDHFLYYGTTTKPLTIAAIKARMEHDYNTNNPHLYLCHSAEFILLWFIMSLLLNSYFQNSQVFVIIGFGWLLHLIEDIIEYLHYYKSFSPWIAYFSIIYYLSLQTKGK